MGPPSPPECSAGYPDLKKKYGNEGIVIRLLMVMGVMMGPRHANAFDTLSIFTWHSEEKRWGDGEGGRKEGLLI